MSARFGWPGIAQLRNGGNSATGNAFEGDVGFDYMGFSMDFVGGKIYDANSVGTTLSAAQLQADQWPPSAFGCSLGCLSAIVSDNTVFAVAAKYTIGPWKLYGGYEHIHYANPNNPLASRRVFRWRLQRRPSPTTTSIRPTKVLQVFWVGVKYAVTPNLDVMGSYYGYRQNNFLQSGYLGR